MQPHTQGPFTCRAPRGRILGTRLHEMQDIDMKRKWDAELL